MNIMSPITVLRRFFSDKDGSMSIEFVLWFPFFLALQGLIADSSLAFMNVNRIYDTARDAGRRASVGDMTAVQAEAYVLSTLPGFINPTVSVDASGTNDLVVSISAPISNLSYFGFFKALTLGDFNVSYTVRKETA